MKRTIILAILALLLPAAARADITPHPLVSSGMVLQQGVACPLWGTAGAGEAIAWTLSTGGDSKDVEGKTKADDKGRWSFKLPVLKAGGPHTLTLKGKNTLVLKDVYVGEVWVCSGQSNMEWQLQATDTGAKAIKTSRNPKIRLFTVPYAVSATPLKTVGGKWSMAEPNSTRFFSAVGYFFGRELHNTLKVPIGLIHSSWGGTAAETWTSKETLQSHPSLRYLANNFDALVKSHQQTLEKHLPTLEKYIADSKKAKKDGKLIGEPPAAPASPFGSWFTPVVRYNAMIKPLQPYAIKGVIWYQGESNAGKAYEYRTLFPAMIKNWRDDWKLGDFPFLFVQLAPFLAISKEPQESAWAELREAQFLTAKNVKNTAMAVITDCGNPIDIHPRKKEPVGVRLALAARAVAYGEKITYSGPIYDALKVENGAAVVSFKSVGKGLEAKGGALTGFTVAGKDKKFYNAKAEIKGDTVVVSSDKVKEPVAVRYGWAHCPVVNLYNKHGLPASPFRTDDFPMVTRPKGK